MVGQPRGRYWETSLRAHEGSLRVRCRDCGLSEGDRSAQGSRDHHKIHGKAEAHHPLVLSCEEELARAQSGARLQEPQQADSQEPRATDASTGSDAGLGRNEDVRQIRFPARVLPDPVGHKLATLLRDSLRQAAVRVL